MIADASLPWLMLAAAALLGGVAFGLLYFAALRRAVDAYVVHRGWGGPLLLTALRLVGAAVAFGLAARLGAVVLLVAFLGFLAARAVALRNARRAA